MKTFFATIVISEATRLAVVLASRDYPILMPRFQTAVVELPRQLGIPQRATEKEQEAMAEVFARTRSRSVVGTMT